MNHRLATDRDLDRLAQWNWELIQDEGHTNYMSLDELRQRMRGWLAAEYQAVIFSLDQEPVAYALYRESEDEVYLRQLFVTRGRRREGVGRKAVELLRTRIWPRDKRLTVEALTANRPAVAFWRSVGFQDYSLKLEIPAC